MQAYDLVSASEKLGISKTTIYSWINKPDYPANCWHILQISKLYGVPVDQMYGFQAGGYDTTQRWQLAQMLSELEDDARQFITSYIDRELNFIFDNDLKSIEFHKKRYIQTSIKYEETGKTREMYPIPGFARRIKMNRTEQKFSIAFLSRYAAVSDASLTLPRMDTHSTGMKKIIPFAMLLNLSLDYLLGTGFAFSNIENEIQRSLYTKLLDLDLSFCSLIASCAIHESEKKEKFLKFLQDREDEPESEPIREF
jgi:transcriptional regulator with XRE-family HTH domain